VKPLQGQNNHDSLHNISSCASENQEKMSQIWQWLMLPYM